MFGLIQAMSTVKDLKSLNIENSKNVKKKEIEYKILEILLVNCTILEYLNLNLLKLKNLHMDIQGAEYYAVKGFGDTIRPKILFCETCEYDSYKDRMTK